MIILFGMRKGDLYDKEETHLCDMLYFFYRSQILGQLKIAGFIRPRGAGDIRDLNSNSNNLAVIKVGSLSGKLIKQNIYL